MIIMAAISLMTIATFGQAKKNKGTIVLVHGAWSDATAWQAVSPLLKAKGHEVIEVNLPGHGSDATPFSGISFQSYVEVVKAAIGERKDVILVGHSMAGLVISQVGEAIPAQIKELVYLAAYLPKDGESLLSLAQQDPDSHVSKFLEIDKDHGAANIAKEGVVEVFAADAPPQVGTYIADHIKPEPLAPLANPVKLTADNFGKLRKVYIYTVNDNTISPKLQHQMVLSAGLTKTYSLPSSHTPFVSMPNKLAAIINEEAK